MTVTIHTGDVLSGLAKIETGTVQTCVTSPPYWGLRDYGVDGQIGLESSPDEFVAKMVAVFSEVRRCLRDDGTLWLNLGDSYAAAPAGNFGPNMAAPADGGTYRANKPAMNYKGVGLKPKDLCMIPWRVALALQADGWWLRSVIVWAKKSPMPESVTDRPTSSWEPIFLLAKSSTYFYDAEAVKEQTQDKEYATVGKIRPTADGRIGFEIRGGLHNQQGGRPTRNQRNVWHLGPEPFTGWIETSRLVPAEAGAVGDDIQRTPSADCPVHGCLDSRQGGEREACLVNHNRDNDAHPEKEHHHEPECTATIRDQQSPADDSGLPFPVHSQTATAHSTQSHRKGLDPVTTKPCTPCVQTGTGTCGTGEQHKISGSVENKIESNTLADCVQDALGSGLSERTISGSEGKCTCKYHRLVTKKIDHFATFPTEIPRRCILAGTSEKGCCAKCGAGWVRVVERRTSTANQSKGYTALCTMRNDAERPGSFTDHLAQTVGWEPSCQCNAGDPVPCLVLEPFLGSGTTLAVAAQLGRNGVGCELNPEYVKLAHDRIGRATRPNTYQSDKAVDAPLFGANHG